MDSSSSIIPFESPEFGTIRTVEQDGRVMFCGKDVATALGYKDTTNALKQHCRGVANHHPIVDQLGREQQARFITEGDLYRLIASSKLPSAQRFESWVFDEVLPTIHAHGGYITPAAAERIISDPDTFIRVLTELKNERRRADLLEAENERMLPAARQAEAFLDASGDYTVTQAAGLLSQVDRSMTRKRLFALLRADEMVEKRSCRATAKAVRRGYLRNIATAYTDGDGGRRLRDPYAVVTPKGLDWMARTYCGAYQPRLPMVV